MKKNKLKRYSWIHEIELDLEVMNNEWWFLKSISDSWNRVIVAYEKQEEEVLDNNIQQDVWENKEDDKEWVISDDWWASE